MASLTTSASARAGSSPAGLPRAGRRAPRAAPLARVRLPLPTRKPAQQDPASATQLNAFWFWNKQANVETEPVGGTVASATALPSPVVTPQRNNVSPAGGILSDKKKAATVTEPVVDDWQRLTNVSYYPNATSKFQASRWHVKKRLGQGRCVTPRPGC